MTMFNFDLVYQVKIKVMFSESQFSHGQGQWTNKWVGMNFSGVQYQANELGKSLH